MKPIFKQEQDFLLARGVDLPSDCWRDGNQIFLDPRHKTPYIKFKVQDNKIIISKKNKEMLDEQRSTVAELIELYTSGLNQQLNLSVCNLYDFIIKNPDVKYVVGHSGGKDSTLTYHVWNMTLDAIAELKPEIFERIKWEVNFCNTSNETVDTYKYIKQNIDKKRLTILNPKIGYYQWLVKIKKYYLPTRLTRNCCSIYKEGQIKKHYDTKEPLIMVTGVRKHESTKRAKYDFIMNSNFRKSIFKVDNLSANWITFAPIVEWTDEEVWLYILKERLLYNRQYDLGFNRCGCLICPFQADYIDLLTQEHYPKIWQKWLRILENNYITQRIKERLKWTLKEWQQGEWKDAKSKVHKKTELKMTEARLKEVAEIQGVSINVAKKYWKKTCRCGKKLNPTEIAMYLKLYGRFENQENDEREFLCKKCLCEDQGMPSKQFQEKARQFSEQGCDLF